MAAAIPQPHITLNPFRGKADENWPNFESLVRRLINVGNFAAANQPQFLQLHLPDQALQFFRTLPQATRDNFDLSITALRNHYCNPNLRELHELQLQKSKIWPQNRQLRGILGSNTNQSSTSLPCPSFCSYTTSKTTKWQKRNRQSCSAQTANQIILDNTVNEKYRRIKEMFTNAMPNLELLLENCWTRMKQRQYRTYVQWLDDRWYSSNYAQVTTGREMHSMKWARHFQKIWSEH